MFGRPEAAQAAKLNIVVGGDGAALTRIESLLLTIGERIWPVGGLPVHANVVKLAGQLHDRECS